MIIRNLNYQGNLKKEDCLKDKKIKSFSKRSSCAPFKDCKKKSVKRKNKTRRKTRKQKKW